jgi:hypothetical protein
MAFKLGNKPLPGIAHGGEIKKKHKFKIEHKNLDEGIVAEAVSANKIVIDKDVPKDSKLYKEAVAHEAVHCKEMGEGRIAYGDDWVRSDGKTYARKDGKIKYNGEWKPEGDPSFPWEQRAMKAENNV